MLLKISQVTLILLSLFLMSCQEVQIKELDKATLNVGRIGVMTTKTDVAQFYKLGAQGLLDMAISSAVTSEFNNHLKTVDISDFHTVGKTFVQKLKQDNYNAVLLESNDLSTFEKMKNKNDNQYELDVRGLKSKYNVDKVILLITKNAGASRTYNGFIALENVKGYYNVEGVMVDLTNNEILWRSFMDYSQATVNIDGEWNEPKNNPKINLAIKTAIENAKAFLINDFFVRK